MASLDEKTRKVRTMTRKIIAERQMGHRTMTGTDWPILDLVERVVWPTTKRPSWLVTIGLCNGIPFTHRKFKTRREAMAWFDHCDSHER